MYATQRTRGRHGARVFEWQVSTRHVGSEALHDKRFSALTDQERQTLVARFEHKVSDHMPLWLRLPLP